jgi:hypothetical protein
MLLPILPLLSLLQLLLQTTVHRVLPAEEPKGEIDS